MQFQLLHKLSIHFAESNFSELDMLFDVLFMKDTTKSGKISKL
jgi:hypothetical protein